MDKVDDVYYSLIGELVSQLPGIPNLFAEGMPCEKWYQEMLDAYEKLRERLGVCDEDEDVETMIHSFLMMQYALCVEMYRLGERHQD